MAYIQSRLVAGKPVIAPWDPKPLQRTDSRALDIDWCIECTSVFFKWQFISLYNKVNVLLAPHKHPHGYWARDRPFKSDHELFRATIWNERAAGNNGNWSPFFFDQWGPPIWPALVPVGLEDKHINQGWFFEVDRYLIQHFSLKRETKVDLRPVVLEPRVVEFWQGTAVNRAFNATSDG